MKLTMTMMMTMMTKMMTAMMTKMMIKMMIKMMTPGGEGQWGSRCSGEGSKPSRRRVGKKSPDCHHHHDFHDNHSDHDDHNYHDYHYNHDKVLPCHRRTQRARTRRRETLPEWIRPIQ